MKKASHPRILLDHESLGNDRNCSTWHRTIAFDSTRMLPSIGATSIHSQVENNRQIEVNENVNEANLIRPGSRDSKAGLLKNMNVLKTNQIYINLSQQGLNFEIQRLMRHDNANHRIVRTRKVHAGSASVYSQQAPLSPRVGQV